MKLEKYLALPLEARRRAHPISKPRGPYSRRPARTAEEIVEYLRTRNIRSSRQLRATRRGDEPIVHNVIRVMGSWSAAMTAAWGRPSPFDAPKTDPIYILKTVVSMGLWRKNDYEKAHRRNPAVTSVYWALKQFGGKWRNVAWGARQLTVNGCLAQWMVLRRRLGNRNPSMAELEAAAIDMTPLRRIYTKLEELNDFLRRIGRVADGKEKQQAKEKFSDVSQDVPASGRA